MLIIPIGWSTAWLNIIDSIENSPPAAKFIICPTVYKHIKNIVLGIRNNIPTIPSNAVVIIFSGPGVPSPSSSSSAASSSSASLVPFASLVASTVDLIKSSGIWVLPSLLKVAADCCCCHLLFSASNFCFIATSLVFAIWLSKSVILSLICCTLYLGDIWFFSASYLISPFFTALNGSNGLVNIGLLGSFGFNFEGNISLVLSNFFSAFPFCSVTLVLIFSHVSSLTSNLALSA